jgi:hypothetical protein
VISLNVGRLNTPLYRNKVYSSFVFGIRWSTSIFDLVNVLVLLLRDFVQIWG